MAKQKTLKIKTNEDLVFDLRWGITDTDTWYELDELWFTVRQDPADDPQNAAIIEASVDNGKVTLGPTPDNWAMINVPYADVKDLDAGTASFDAVARRASDGRRKNIYSGKAIIEEGVSNPD